MKKKLIIVSLLIITILTIFYFSFDSYEDKGNILINKIETFRQIEKRLPDNLTDLGIEDPMNSGPYYEKKDSVDYIVFFAVGFDETYTYYSDKKAWKTEH